MRFGSVKRQISYYQRVGGLQDQIPTCKRHQKILKQGCYAQRNNKRILYKQTTKL